MNLKKLLVISISLFILVQTYITVNASSTEESINKMRTDSYDFLSMVKVHHYQAATDILTDIEEITSNRGLLPAREVTSLTNMIEQTKQILISQQKGNVEKYNHSMQLVLVIDALMNSEDPLWKNWKANLEDKVLLALESDDQEVDQYLGEIINEYEQLYPAMKRSATENESVQLDEIYQQMQQINAATTMEEKEKFLQKLYHTLDDLDKNKLKTLKDEDPSLFWMIFSVGGFIIFTLMYVVWKKYKGEKEQKQVKKVDEDN